MTILHRVWTTSTIILATLALLSPLSAATSRQYIDLGDTVSGELLAAGDTIELIFGAVGNTRIDVLVKAGKNGDLIPSLSLKDESGADVPLERNLISKGSKAQIKKFIIESSGTYVLEISAASGAGNFTARTKAKFPKKFEFAGDFPSGDRVNFDIMLGTELKGGKVKASRDSTYEPEILDLLADFGTLRIEGNSSKGSSAKFKSASAPISGLWWVRVTWSLGGTGEGGYTARISAKAPRTKRAVDLVPAATPEFSELGVNPVNGLMEYRHVQTGIDFVLLPGGTFQMGSPNDEPGRWREEGPVHEVTLSPFLCAKYEVTQAQYEAVMGENPSRFTGDDSRPVEGMTWNDLMAADGFLARTGLSLPTEAQWEYACRAGQSGPYSGTGQLDDLGWYRDNSGNEPQPVGGKQPNQFGLYDMHGNVLEWCDDVLDWDFYSKPNATSPDPLSIGGNSGLRTLRGGGWTSFPEHCRSASRTGSSPGFFRSAGFRPVSPAP